MNGKDLLIGFGDISQKYYAEAENEGFAPLETGSRGHPHKGKKSTLKLLLIAAVILSLSATAYAAVIRNLNWSPETQENLTSYNEETGAGVAAMDWYIGDVDVYLSIDQPVSGALSISAETWTEKAEGTLETGSEYWIEKWNGTSYQEIPTLDGTPWKVPTQTLPCSGSFSWTADYSENFGQLAPGHYRLGMMIALLSPTGERTEMGCYAKFQIYTEEIGPYVDSYAKALDALIQGDTFHIRVEEHYGNDPMVAGKYNITEVWKADQNYFQHSVTYSSDGSYCWDFGNLLRNGSGYELTFGSPEADTAPSTVMEVGFLEPFNFTLDLSEFDFFKTGVDSVTEDGSAVLLRKEEETIYGVHFGVRSVEVRYSASGAIANLTFVDEEWDRTIAVEVLDDTPEAIRTRVQAIDVVTPRSFSYAQEAEALAHLSYAQIRSDFRNTSPVSGMNRDRALELAKQECTRADYNVYTVSYDPASDMWKVEFGISWDSYYYEVVYLTGTGQTQLIATRPYPEPGEALLPKPDEYEE